MNSAMEKPATMSVSSAMTAHIAPILGSEAEFTASGHTLAQTSVCICTLSAYPERRASHMLTLSDALTFIYVTPGCMVFRGLFVCWSLTSLCHSNGHIETMPAREINPFTALTRIRSQFLRTQ